MRMKARLTHAEKQARFAGFREKESREKADEARKLLMPQYMAVVTLDTHARFIDRLVNENIAGREFYNYIAQAALDAGDLLCSAYKQLARFPERYIPLEEMPKHIRFEVYVNFVSERDNWDQASAWLTDALAAYENENINVVSMKRF